MEQTQQHIPFFETLWIGCLLAIGGGFLDAYTYQLHGHVFANAQTGNLVLLGIQMANGHFLTALYYLIPIIAFIAGILLTELIKRRGNFRWILWQHLALCFEIMLLLGIGFLPLSLPDSIVNVTVSFICAIQVNSFAMLHGASYATTMCTGNLRSGTRCFFQFLAEKDREAGKQSLRYFMILACFCGGAALGVFLSALWLEKAVWVCCGIFLAVLVSSFVVRHCGHTVHS